jgi:hypothetical protein
MGEANNRGCTAAPQNLVLANPFATTIGNIYMLSVIVTAQPMPPVAYIPNLFESNQSDRFDFNRTHLPCQLEVGLE